MVLGGPNEDCTMKDGRGICVGGFPGRSTLPEAAINSAFRGKGYQSKNAERGSCGLVKH